MREYLTERIDASGDCWEWIGPTTGKNGYGAALKANQRTLTTAHRAVWVELVGPVPDDHDVDHLCRNRLCVNPDHLEPVTKSENQLRRKGWSHPWEGRITHGTTTGYRYHGCRCEDCRRANTESLREYRASQV